MRPPANPLKTPIASKASLEEVGLGKDWLEESEESWLMRGISLVVLIKKTD